MFTKAERGFTLVEILVSLIIILIMVMATVPMYEVIAKTMNSNKYRQVATGLANSILEEVRTLPYIVKDPDTGQVVTDPNIPQLGIKGGNPPGSLDAERQIEIDGITYKVYTRVYWVKEGDNPTAYKKVEIRVEAPNAFNGNVTVSSDFHTLAAEEGEPQVFESGHIAVHIRDKDGNLLESPDVYVRIESDTLLQTNYSEDGEVTFGVIPAGNYTVYAQLPSGMVTRPDQVVTSGWIEQEVTVTNWNTEHVYFDMDYPGRISIALADANNSVEKLTTVNGICELSWTDGVTRFTLPRITFSEDDFEDDGYLPSSIIGKLWPGGNYSLKLTNVMDRETLRAYEYDMSKSASAPPKKSNGSDWDGSFSTANSSLDLTVQLDSLLTTHLIASPDSVETQLNEGGIIQVTQWKDQSGYNYNAFPTNNTPPSFVENVLNGHPVIRFSGEQKQYIQINIPTENKPKDNFTIFAVVKTDEEHEIDPENTNSVAGVNNQKYLFWPDHGGFENAGQGISLGTNGISNYEHGDNYMPANAVYSGNVQGFNIIAVNYYDKTPSIFLNGNMVREGQQSPRASVSSPTIIGGGPYGDFTGDVAEILIYACSLNEDNMLLVNNYLQAKYGL